MNLENLRSIILIIGWPVLIVASILITGKAYNFYKKTQKLALGKFALAQTVAVIVSMYCLGIVSTAFMFCKADKGVLVVLPIFIIWFITIMCIYYVSEKWKDEAVKINILYYKIKERTKRLKQEKDKLTHIAQNMETGAILLDHSGKPMFINREAKEIIGSKTNDEEKLLNLLYKKFSKFRLKEKVANCIKGSPSNIQDIEMEGRLYEIYLRFLVDHSDSDAYFGHFIWIRDVTDEKVLEQAKNKFLTVVSHKLRTPLSGLRGLIDMVSRDKKGKLSESQKDYLKDMNSCMEITVDLVNQIFYASEAEIKKLEVSLKQTELCSIVKRVINELSKLAKEYKCKISISKCDKCPVTTDSKMLKKVIQNLIENAVIYSDNKKAKTLKKVEIKVKKEKERFVISIKDKGIGIPKTDKKNIYEKFYRSENALKIYTEGVGLNLNMSKDIINSLGGDIWFESKTNKGTEFFIAVPVKPQKGKMRIK